LGTVLGVAVLGAIFSAVGGYTSGQSFVDGLRAAQYVGAAVLATAAIVALFLPAARPQPVPAIAQPLAEPVAA
jgi:hypothetical protein